VRAGDRVRPRRDFAELFERKLTTCLKRLGYDIEIKYKSMTDPVGRLALAVARARRLGR
jgi:hypothetical protein